MKFTKNILIKLILASAFSAGCAASENIREGFDLYEAPPYVLKLARTEMKSPEPELLEDKQAKAAVAQLGKEKARLLEAAESVSDRDSFYAIELGVVNKLKQVAENDQSAESIFEKKISLEKLKAMTILRNPGVKAAENRLRAELESFSQVANLDEILRQYAAFTAALMTGVGPMKGKEPMSKQFPFPGVTALKGHVVRKAVEAAKEDLEIARRDAVTKASKAFWELTYAEKAQDVTFETLELLKHLETVADSLYRSGDTSFQDIIKIRIRIGILEEELTTMKEMQRNLHAEIIELVNISQKAKIGRTKKVHPSLNVPSLDALYALAMEKRQEIQSLRAEIGKMERMIEMTETMIMPSYTLGFSFFENEAISTVGTDATKLAFSTTSAASRGAGLPKSPWYGVNDPWLRQTRMKLEAKRNDLENAVAETGALLRKAWFKLDKAVREYRLYRHRIVDLSKSALEVSSRGYESGTVSFSDVIGSYTMWLEVNLAEARKKSDVGIAMASLQKAVGAQIENINGDRSDEW